VITDEEIDRLFVTEFNLREQELFPDHPEANLWGYVKRAVLILEKHLGRYLTHGENIHHINGIKDDDRIENLKIMTNKEHTKLHAQMRNHHKKKGDDGKFISMLA
jgi:uncharacterized protein (DUF1330 family)